MPFAMNEYTAEEVDTLLVRLESCVERTVANKDSVVKVRASEKELIGAVETARDLLQKALRGDKDILEEVFGDSSARIDGLRHVLDNPICSEMHAGDARWNDLKNMAMCVEVRTQARRRRCSIKAISDQKGLPLDCNELPEQELSGNPFSFTDCSGRSASFTDSPADLHYPELPAELALFVMVQFCPEVKGEVDLYFVSPALPKGMLIDIDTGIIRGTPMVSAPSRTYEIFADNSTEGSLTAEMTFEVKAMPPKDLQYPTMVSHRLKVGQELSLAPQVVGYAKSFSVEPPLPEGLVLDSSTGYISGAALATSDDQTYMVTVHNDAGDAWEALSFAVVQP